MIIALGRPFVALLEDAAVRAARAGAVLVVDDLLAALLAEPGLGAGLAPAIAAPERWTRPGSVAATTAGLWVEDRCLRFDVESLRLVTAGARAVLTGAYEPRHLAQAVVDAADADPGRFRRFALDRPAWRRALRARSAGA